LVWLEVSCTLQNSCLSINKEWWSEEAKIKDTATV